MARPEVLIERWLPIDIIGAESMRDASAAQKPPLNRLHVWWARRPLTTGRAAILASVLPAWSADWPAHLREKFPTEDSYRQWFLQACGIFGDPVAGRKLLQWARAQGRVIPNPYTHKRAFTVSPAPEILETIGELIEHTWGTRDLAVLDPFAGGGSIPFEALRYGFRTYANELNPVASVILKATLDYPARFGPGLADDIRKYGRILTSRVQKRLRPFYTEIEAHYPDAEGVAYIWARSVACPYTGRPIPLSPNWWLRKGSDPLAVRPIFAPNADAPTFQIVKGKRDCQRLDPDQGTVRRGNAISPWAGNQAVDGDYIKAEAQAGRMGQILYALAVKRQGGFAFRTPSEDDLRGVQAAEAELRRWLPDWEARGIVPLDPIPDGNKTSEPLRYGMRRWGDMFAPRQLLALCMFVEELHALRKQIERDLRHEKSRAVATYLQFIIGKASNYSSRMSVWHPTRVSLANTFDRHDFSFKWTHGEMDAARNQFPWGLDQVADAYKGMAVLAKREGNLIDSENPQAAVTVTQGGAASLSGLLDRSIAAIVVDPPYYDNVMYAELSDFFYVWMKRTLAGAYPEFFNDELTNKDDEAVANVARFADLGRMRKELALADYQLKMGAAFREMHRVLKDNGVITVMFTHKKVEAWDTLATSLINAGFAIHASWPVHTESEHSLHQAKKNAAKSTILLTCRKRATCSEPVWWDDIKGRVRQVAREKAEEFEQQGIRGVDLYIATFGPTLAILSESWPVLTSEMDERTGEPKPLRPEVALDLAREEVVALRKRGLLLGRAVQFDPYTDWYLMAWDAFRAEEFPADEARKLALALGLDLEREVIADKRLVAKKSSNVVLQKPSARRRRGLVDPDRDAFEHMVDAVHTAMLLYLDDGATACEAFLRRTGLRNDATFKACLQAMINAIPRTRQKGDFVRSEAKVLEDLRLAFFDDLVVPPEELPTFDVAQLALAGLDADAEDDIEDIDEDEDDEES